MSWNQFWCTLYFYNNEPSKNKHFLILLSSLARNSQEPKLKRIFEILWVLFEKISVFYSYWPKSWIWRTLGHVIAIFVNVIFIMLQKKSFGQMNFWISYSGLKMPLWQLFDSGKKTYSQNEFLKADQDRQKIAAGWAELAVLSCNLS